MLLESDNSWQPVSLPLVLENVGDWRLRISEIVVEPETDLFSIDSDLVDLGSPTDLVLLPGDKLSLTVRYEPQDQVQAKVDLVVRTDWTEKPELRMVLEGRIDEDSGEDNGEDNCACSTSATSAKA